MSEEDLTISVLKGTVKRRRRVLCNVILPIPEGATREETRGEIKMKAVGVKDCDKLL